jgi:PAS domain S-box-containing protein
MTSAETAIAGEPLAPAWTESDRLRALARYDILDTPPEPDFDDIAKLAAEAFAAPIAVINLITEDRQWFKAEIGLGMRETPLDVSICAHAILQNDLLIVPDCTRDPRFAENPLVTADGGLRFYAGALLKTAEGLPIGTVCVLDRVARPQGITAFQRLTLEVLARQVMTNLELRRALTAQREDEKRNRLILDSAVDYAIITMDPHGMITSWNEGAFRLMGWRAADICGQSCEVFFTPEDCANGRPWEEMAKALSDGRSADDRWHMRQDGSRFMAHGEMMPLTNDDDVPVGFLKIVRDRTAEHAARAALEASEARTRLALEAAQIGTWESDPLRNVITWDARTRELLGHSADEPLDSGNSFLEHVHPDDHANVAAHNEAARGVGGEGIVNIEYRTISAVDGRERWVQVKGAVAQGPDGEPRFVGIVRDISAEKDAENHRRMLTAELQHRMKNTLAVVQSIVSQSLRGAPTAQAASESIRERLMTLGHAHDLLTQTSWTAAPIAAVLAGATRHGAQTGRVQITGPDLALAPRAALAMSLCLHELSTNATKYGALSVPTGHVELTWSREPDETGRDAFLAMSWREFGGPPVIRPERKGFGTRLMENLSYDLGGETTLDYAPDGIVWQLRSELARITDQP